MDKNISNDVGAIRFTATNSYAYSVYKLQPLQVEGYWSEMVRGVLQNFNWKYEANIDGSFIDYGKIYGEGNGTGMLGYLARNESDVALSPTVLSPDDFRFLDYSPIMWETDVNIISSEACLTSFKSSDFAFADIYSPWVWLAWGISMFLFIVFWISAKIHLSTYDNETVRGSSCNNVTEVVLQTYGIPLNQGAKMPPSKHGHLRQAVICWIVGCFLLNVGFTGGLLTKLTLPPKPNFIEKMEDILNYPNLLIQIFKDSAIFRNFQISKNKVLRKIHDQIIRLDSAIDIGQFNATAITESVIGGKMVTFLREDVMKVMWPLITKCDFLKKVHISKESAFKMQFALPMRKNLDPRKAKIFKRTIQSLFEATITTKALSFDYWRYSKCFANDPIPPTQLRISAIKVISYGLLLGYLISAITLMFELK